MPSETRDCLAARTRELCADPTSEGASGDGFAVLAGPVAGFGFDRLFLFLLFGRADGCEELFRHGLLDERQEFFFVVGVAQDAQGDRSARALRVASGVLLP